MSKVTATGVRNIRPVRSMKPEIESLAVVLCLHTVAHHVHHVGFIG